MYLLGLPCPEEYCIIGRKEGTKISDTQDYSPVDSL